MAAKRLLKEWKNWTEAPPKNCVLLESTVPESKWMIAYSAPADSLYEGGKFHISLEFVNYPFKAPILTFLTPIYHPNFSDKGEICQNVYEVDWAPTQKVTDVIAAVDGVMVYIDESNPLRDEIAVVFRDNQKQFVKTKNEWIAKHNFKG
jgi:ubiquitin-conjugating enzyme E2 D/E